MTLTSVLLATATPIAPKQRRQNPPLGRDSWTSELPQEFPNSHFTTPLTHGPQKMSFMLSSIPGDVLT